MISIRNLMFMIFLIISLQQILIILLKFNTLFFNRSFIYIYTSWICFTKCIKSNSWWNIWIFIYFYRRIFIDFFVNFTFTGISWIYYLCSIRVNIFLWIIWILSICLSSFIITYYFLIILLVFIFLILIYFILFILLHIYLCF